MNIGDPAPDFELPDDNGTTVRLSDLLARGPVVLYFYPQAMTPGCTKEGCHFRDLAAEFEAVGAQRVGISADAVTKQKQFSSKYGFDFPLLSDADRQVASAYGVRRRGPAFIPNKRITFVIDRDGTVKEIISSELNFNVHADKALAALKALQPS